MKTRHLLLLLVFPFLLALQTPQLELRLSRDWGYGGLDNRIQGRFSMHASGPDSLVEVRFRIDGAVVSVDTEAPYRYQFETRDYPPGRREMSATGLMADGTEIESAVIVRVFLTAEEAGEETVGVVAPLLYIIGGMTVVGVILPLLFGRRKPFRPGVYGAAGAAVCPRCSLPFSRGVLSPNLLIGKLERCPHCGKWSIVPRAPEAAVQEAEARYRGESAGEGEAFESPEEKKARLLDETRFDS